MLCWEGELREDKDSLIGDFVHRRMQIAKVDNCKTNDGSKSQSFFLAIELILKI